MFVPLCVFRCLFFWFKDRRVFVCACVVVDQSSFLIGSSFLCVCVFFLCLYCRGFVLLSLYCVCSYVCICIFVIVCCCLCFVVCVVFMCVFFGVVV